MGSKSRSDTFKNMLVGAAAGYLSYKGGKAIIRNIGKYDLSMISFLITLISNLNYYLNFNYYETLDHRIFRVVQHVPDPPFSRFFFTVGSEENEYTNWVLRYTNQISTILVLLEVEINT